MLIGIVLNRPSASLVRFRSTYESRRMNLGGEYSQTPDRIILLHRLESLEEISQPIGDSGVWQIGVSEADNAMSSGKARAEDFLCCSGLCKFERTNFEGFIREGGFDVIDMPPWDDIFDLSNRQVSRGDLSESCRIWDSCASSGDEASTMDTSREALADTALERFARFFLNPKQ